jgi:hypothetical protein
MHPPITPGEILLEEYLTPMGISQNAMARAIGVEGIVGFGFLTVNTFFRLRRFRRLKSFLEREGGEQFGRQV